MPFPAGSPLILVPAGIATWLAEHGVLDRDPAEQYSAADEWPTYCGIETTAKPDQKIQIGAYAMSAQRANLWMRIQVRVRGAQDAPSDGVFEKLQEISDLFTPNGFPRINTDMGSVRISRMNAGDVADLGRDTQRRQSAVQNFDVRVRRIPSGSPSPVGAGFGTSGFGTGGFGL